MEEEQAVQRGPLRVWGDHRKGKQAAAPNGHQDGLDAQILRVNAGIAWTSLAGCGMCLASSSPFPFFQHSFCFSKMNKYYFCNFLKGKFKKNQLQPKTSLAPTSSKEIQRTGYPPLTRQMFLCLPAHGWSRWRPNPERMASKWRTLSLEAPNRGESIPSSKGRARGT